MAKKVSKAPKAEVLEPIVEQAVGLVATESVGLIAWLQGLTTFFIGARSLEVAAIARRDHVARLTVPETKEQDAIVRQAVIAARKGRLATVDYWDAVTGALSRVHKLTTAARARAVDPDREAEERGTRLHDTYVANEQRRAAAEAERTRVAEEQRAAEERRKNLDATEAAAVAAEESSPELSPREEKFVLDYMVGGNAIASANRAGYRDPAAMGPRLIASDKIRAAIEARKTAAQIRQRAEITRSLPLAVDEDKVEAAATPQLNKGDRYRWTATVVDVERFRDAAFEGGHGIPRDCFDHNPAKINEYARSMEALIERWPGVKAERKTTVL